MEKKMRVEIWTKTREGLPFSPTDPLLQPLIIEAEQPGTGVAKFTKGTGIIEVMIVNFLNIHEAELLIANPRIKEATPFYDECGTGTGWGKHGSVIVEVPKNASFEESVRIAADVIAGALNVTLLETEQK